MCFRWANTSFQRSLGPQTCRPVVIVLVMQSLWGPAFEAAENFTQTSNLLTICVMTEASWSPQAFRQKCETPSGSGAFLNCVYMHLSNQVAERNQVTQVTGKCLNAL